MDRAERARRRHGDEAPVQDEDNPCPSVIDPITLEPVVTPAISPYGHVMGLATWNAVLAEQGKCPFTQQPLRRDQVIHPLLLLFPHCLFVMSSSLMVPIAMQYLGSYACHLWLTSAALQVDPCDLTQPLSLCRLSR